VGPQAALPGISGLADQQDAEVSSEGLAADLEVDSVVAVVDVVEVEVAGHTRGRHRALLAHGMNNSSPAPQFQTSVCGQCAEGEKGR
jgi:hypothetical protein